MEPREGQPGTPGRPSGGTADPERQPVPVMLTADQAQALWKYRPLGRPGRLSSLRNRHFRSEQAAGMAGVNGEEGHRKYWSARG